MGNLNAIRRTSTGAAAAAGAGRMRLRRTDADSGANHTAAARRTGRHCLGADRHRQDGCIHPAGLATARRAGFPPRSKRRGAGVPRVLVLAPTRELAQQVATQSTRYGQNLRLRTVCLFGGAPYPPQNRELERGVDVLVATPGRLLDHIERGRVDLSRLQILVLDEADRMLDMGFQEDVDRDVRAGASGASNSAFFGDDRRRNRPPCRTPDARAGAHRCRAGAVSPGRHRAARAFRR